MAVSRIIQKSQNHGLDKDNPCEAHTPYMSFSYNGQTFGSNWQEKIRGQSESEREREREAYNFLFLFIFE